MKAILNTKSKNYSHLNGLTFEISDLLNGNVGLIGINKEFPKNQVDFSFDEIFIVDIETELQKASEDNDWYGGYERGYKLQALKYYCQMKGLKLETKFVPAQ
jgi:hypothetical protein